MKFTTRLAALLFGIMAISAAHAQEETTFYTNTYPAVFTLAPVYYTTGTSEWADDIPFTGSHLVSSFVMGYKSPEPVRAIFRFYGVDPVTGKPGQFVAEVSRELPAGEGTPLIQLTADERFQFTAEPGLNKTTVSGGWFSVKFEPVFSSNLPYGLQLRLATGSSSNTFYNLTTGQTVATLDPDGLLPASFYLELHSAGSVNVAVPQVAEVQLLPSTVSAGASARATVILDSQAPVGGVLVKVASSKPRVAYLPYSEVLIPAGSDRVGFSVSTSSRIGRKSQDVEISAEASNGRAAAILTVTP